MKTSIKLLILRLALGLIVSPVAAANSVDVASWLYASGNNSNQPQLNQTVDISGIVDDGIKNMHIESVLYSEQGLAVEFDLVEGK